MNNQDYNATLTVSNTPKEAFDAINRVSDWWTANLEGSTKNPGDVFTLHWGDSFVTIKLVEAVPGKKVLWQVTDCDLKWLDDKKEWRDTKMDFEISTVGDKTRINFTHIGLVPQVQCYNDCVKGWDQYVKGSLLKMLTEGIGEPQKLAAA